jgi:ACR3 family arsenite efflux pump ArsB
MFTEANEYFSNRELKILLLSSGLNWIRGPHIFVFKSPMKNIFPTSLEEFLKKRGKYG